VTFGLLASDLATGTSGHLGAGAGMVISLIGWLACAIGSVAALRVRPAAVMAASPAPAAEQANLEQATAEQATAEQANLEQANLEQATPEQATPPAPQAAVGYGTPASVFGAPGAAAYGRPGGYGSPAPGRTPAGIAAAGRANAGAIALLALCAIGTVASFVPSWDSYTITQASTGSSVTQTAGNAFQNPGTVIFGDMAVVVAVIAVAVLAGLWRPARHGAALLGGVIVAMAAQAISALIQASQATSPEIFGFSAAQAQAQGLSVSSGVTSIFWVFCLFVVAMALACAWLVTTPSASPLANPFQPNPGSGYPGSGYQAVAEPPAVATESEHEESLAEDTVRGATDDADSASSEVSTL
jgi:hypothetical protein